MLSFFQNLSVGFLAAIAAFTGAFHSAPQPLATSSAIVEINATLEATSTATTSSSVSPRAPEAKQVVSNPLLVNEPNLPLSAASATTSPPQKTGQTYTLPNGTVVDSNGNIIQTAPQQSTPQDDQQSQQNGQAAELTAYYNSQLNALQQQILSIRTKYYSDAANPTLFEGDTTEMEQGILQQDEAQANLQIAQIQEQEQQLYTNYQEQLQALQ